MTTSQTASHISVDLRRGQWISSGRGMFQVSPSVVDVVLGWKVYPSSGELQFVEVPVAEAAREVPALRGVSGSAPQGALFERHGENAAAARGSDLREERQSADQSERPIWEVVAELGAQIPEDELARLPRDGSLNYRHYLYGSRRVGE